MSKPKHLVRFCQKTSLSYADGMRRHMALIAARFSTTALIDAGVLHISGRETYGMVDVFFGPDCRELINAFSWSFVPDNGPIHSRGKAKAMINRRVEAAAGVIAETDATDSPPYLPVITGLGAAWCVEGLEKDGEALGSLDLVNDWVDGEGVNIEVYGVRKETKWWQPGLYGVLHSAGASTAIAWVPGSVDDAAAISWAESFERYYELVRTRLVRVTSARFPLVAGGGLAGRYA